MSEFKDEKYYPGREDIISVVRGMYKKDGLSVLARGSRL